MADKTETPTPTALVFGIDDASAEAQLREANTGRVVLRFDLTHAFAPVLASIVMEGLQVYAAANGIPFTSGQTAKH